MPCACSKKELCLLRPRMLNVKRHCLSPQLEQKMTMMDFWEKNKQTCDTFPASCFARAAQRAITAIPKPSRIPGDCASATTVVNENKSCFTTNKGGNIRIFKDHHDIDKLQCKRY